MTTLQHSPAETPSDLIEQWRRSGYHTDTTIPALLAFNATYRADLSAVFDEGVVLTWADLAERAHRLAVSLSDAGVGAGDVVTWQLPNWWECFVTAHAIWLVGAINNPVLTVYGPHELRHILGQVRPAAIVAGASFRGREIAADLDTVCEQLDHRPVARIAVRGGRVGWTSFDDCIRSDQPDGGASDLPLAGETRDPREPTLVVFTSGTTGSPKGVVHSTQTYLASALVHVRCRPTTSADRFYMPSPIGHASGVSRGLGIPLVSGGAVVLRDRWDPDRAIDDIAEFGITIIGGAIVFMQELMEALDRRGIDRFELANGFGSGGSSAPVAVLERAERIGLHPSRAYGMTECINTSFGSPGASVDERHHTDGRLAPGTEIKVVDDAGSTVSPDTAGEICVRGPQRAVGYIDATHTADAFDADGWFHTGDIGIATPSGHVKITGRLKDIINRGGFKFATREVEELLAAHPDVHEAVVVPIPHARFGEQPAAVLRVREGQQPTEQALETFLRQCGLAVQKFPMVWRFVDEMPRTASGKVKKHELTSTLSAAATSALGD